MGRLSRNLALVSVAVISTFLACREKAGDQTEQGGDGPTPADTLTRLPVARMAIDGDYLQQLVREEKETVPIEVFRRQFALVDELPRMHTQSGSFALIPLALMVEEEAEQAPGARAIPDDVASYRDYISARILDESLDNVARIQAAVPPSAADHTARQTRIKFQGTRGTCVAHAALAALESRPEVPDDLSEEYAYHLFMGKISSNCCRDPGIKTTAAALYLSEDGVPAESSWRYRPERPNCGAGTNCDVPAHSLPAGATAASKTKITRYELIPDAGLAGRSIKNPAYLESLIAAGHDVVWGTHVAWDDSKNDRILDVVFTTGTREPAPSVGGHAMVIVGYNRNQGYFIVKNSWGPEWGHAGYGHFSYDYVRTYGKYGYVVRQTSTGP